MKKIVRIVLISVLSLLALLILLPFIFRGRLEMMVRERINQEVRAHVEWSGISASFFRGFPNLSVTLHSLSVVGEAPFEGDTLAGLEQFELRMNPLGLFRQNVEVHSLLLHRPLIRGEVLENGVANWEIFPGEEGVEPPDEEQIEKGETAEKEASEKSLKLTLKRLVISEGRLQYTDHSSGLESSVGRVDLDLRGEFSLEQTDLRLFLEMEDLDAELGGIRYLKDGSFEMQMEAGANMAEGLITLRNNEIRLNGLTLEGEGGLALLGDQGIDMDLRFLTKETSFQTLLSLVPAIYLNDFKSLRTGGTVSLEGGIKGMLNDTLMPDMSLFLKVNDGYFSYPDLPGDVSDVQIDLHLQYDGNNTDASRVEVDRLHMLLGGNPFDLRFSLANPVSDMHVAGSAVGTIDFSSLRDILPLNDMTIGGKLETDLKWDTRISAIEEERYDEVELQGNLMATDLRMELPDLPVPVQIRQLMAEFNPRVVELQRLEMELGTSDLQLEGELANFIPYLLDEQVVHGSLNVTSSHFDLDKLIIADTGGNAAPALTDTTDLQHDGDQLLPAPPDSLAVPGGIKIPESIDFSLSLAMDQVLFHQMNARNLEGILRAREGMAMLEQLKLDLLEGSIVLAGVADTRGEFLKVDATVDVEGIDIPSAYSQLVAVERLAPMARYCRGSANLKMNYSSMLDREFTPLYESINATGLVYTKDLQIYNLETFVKISDLVRNEKFREMAPDEVRIPFKINDGRVVVDPFDMNFDQSKITVSGSHGIDHTLDYLVDMNIAKKDLGEGANGMLNSLTLLASVAGMQVAQSEFVKVKAHITGTFSDPKVATDLSGNLASAGVSAIIQNATAYMIINNMLLRYIARLRFSA